MTNILAFDTSTDACSVGLSVNGEYLLREKIAPRQHTDLILPMIDELLAEASVSVSQLDAIAFGAGPGSFMGVRIAAGIAQGIAFAQDLPVITISSLRALAQGVFNRDSHRKYILAGWDARMQQLYAGFYRADAQGVMQAVQADALLDPEDVHVKGDANYFAVGNAWDEYRDRLPEQLLKHVEVSPDIDYPSASGLLTIAGAEFEQQRFVDAADVRPVYLRNDVAKKSIRAS